MAKEKIVLSASDELFSAYNVYHQDGPLILRYSQSLELQYLINIARGAENIMSWPADEEWTDPDSPLFPWWCRFNDLKYEIDMGNVPAVVYQRFADRKTRVKRDNLVSYKRKYNCLWLDEVCAQWSDALADEGEL